MSTYQRLASASLAAAAVALVAAACGSTPTHNPQAACSGPTTQASCSSPTPQATSSSPTPTATSSPTTPATSSPTTPATSSSPTQPANSAYTYEPGGVTYNGGEGGAVETFSIPAGTYSLNQQASYDPANDPDGTGECLFGGELITAQVPIDGPPSTAPYPAGNYRLYIYPSTTCSWTVELGPDS
jgi:hypothetical protein